ncbi:MAG: HAD family phosphatase [Clostridiales bacterium]|nr:HAD family phosphatase [Clostridiales bacterium]
MKISGAIFDLDGTLLDSMHIWRNAAGGYLERHSMPVDSALWNRICAMSLRQSATMFHEEMGVSDTPEQIMNDINSSIEEFYFNVAAPKPGAKEFIEKLGNAGVKMCIASATDRYLVCAALERNGMLSYFEDVITCTMVGAGKGKPDIFLRALEVLKTPKDETFIFEDALYAIRTAKAAGFKVAAVYDRFSHDEQDEIKSLADVYAPLVRDFDFSF